MPSASARIGGVTALHGSYVRGHQHLDEVVFAAHARARQPDQAGIWIALADEDALRRRVAELSRVAPGSSPLWGIPFAVKDNIDVAGWPTTAGCPAFAYRPAQSAAAVTRLLDAGAVLIGKTNLDQFATGLVGTRSPYGTPVNPLDPELVPGGSSSGSAVAVARACVSFALGTDTAGSGRVPAAMTGIVGLKPTRGLVSTLGVVPACRTLDCVSVFARDVSDAWLVHDVMAQHEPADPYSRLAPPSAGSGHGSVRVGIPALGLDAFDGDEIMRDAFAAAAAQLVAAGVSTVTIEVRPLLLAGELLYGGPWVAERAAAVGDFIREHPDDVLDVTRQIILSDFEPTGVQVFRSMYELAGLRRDAERLFADVDAVLMPTVPTVVGLAEEAAQPLERNSLLGRFTSATNLLDLAALALPGPRRADGRPAGVTLMGPAFSDRLLAEIGTRFAAAAEPATVEVLVVGAHMRGLALEAQLRDLGGEFLAVTRTAAGYRLLALNHLSPPRPGLVADPTAAGNLEAEEWRLPAHGLGTLLTLISSPLSLGPVKLMDGRTIVGFLCSAGLAASAPDITAHGGWRAYLRQQE